MDRKKCFSEDFIFDKIKFENVKLTVNRIIWKIIIIKKVEIVILIIEFIYKDEK